MTLHADPDSRPPIAAAIIVNDGRVLMARRRVREGTLSWQFPAGQLEDGESPEDAAVRETREEVGLTVVASRLLGERVHPATGRQMAYVLCEVVDGTARVADSEELAEIAWCDRPTLAEYVPTGLFSPVRNYLDDVLAG